MKTLPSTFVATIVLLRCTGRRVALQEHMGVENGLIVQNYRSELNPFFLSRFHFLSGLGDLSSKIAVQDQGVRIRVWGSASGVKVARAVPKRCSESRRSAFAFQMSSCPVCRNPAYVVPFALQRQPERHLPVAPTHLLSM